MSDLELVFGESKTLDVTVTDQDGAAVDITGSAFWFTVKRDWLDADADALLLREVGTGITITDPGTDGLATIAIEPADFAAFLNEPERFVWGITEKDISTNVWRLDRGTLLISPAAQEVIS